MLKVDPLKPYVQVTNGDACPDSDIAKLGIGADTDKTLDECALACYNDQACVEIRHSAVSSACGDNCCRLFRDGCTHEAVTDYTGYEVPNVVSPTRETINKCEIFSLSYSMSKDGSTASLESASGRDNYRLVEWRQWPSTRTSACTHALDESDSDSWII